MPRKKSLNPFNEPAIRADVENIVTRVVSSLVTTLIPPIVEKIVDQKLDEKLDKKLDERFDSFAIMVKHGFDDTQAQINEIRQEMVTKTEFNDFKGEMLEFKGDTEQSLFCLQSDVTDLKERVGKVENRLDGVEGAIGVMTGMWRDHEVRIVDLEGLSA